jgi:IS30 family transposase
VRSPGIGRIIKAFAIDTDMMVYFCDPSSPWQRDTNENTNSMGMYNQTQPNEIANKLK